MSRFAWLLALAALSCGGAAAPATYTLSAPGITVEVLAHPLTLTVRDGTGRAVLASRTPTGALGFATGSFDIHATLSPGYFSYQQHFDPWHDDWTVESATPGPQSLDLVLAAAPAGVPRVRVHLSARASALRVEAAVDGDLKPRAWQAAFASPTDEAFLGLGERFTRTNFRGLRMYNWAEEGGIGNGEGMPPGLANPFPNGEAMAYYPVPYFLSTRGYGFWLDSTWFSEYDLAVSESDAWKVWHIGPTLAFEVFVPIPGDARPWPYHIIDLFTARTGRPMRAPAWAYGPRRRIGHGSQVNGVSELQAMRDQDLAVTIMDDNNHFLPRGPVPGETERFAADNVNAKRLGYRVVGYFNGMVSDNPADPIAAVAAAGAAAGYYLKTATGDWSKGWILTGGNVVNLYIVDFTSAAAASWYTGLFDAALAAGYSGWMYDFGEYTAPDAVGANGMTGEELHNLWPVLYQKAAFDKLEGGALRGDWLTYVRSGYTGASQWSPTVWSGDPAASFDPADGLPSMLRGAINMGVSGVPNWGGDIGGYHCLADGDEKADGEVLTRWIEEGAMEPGMHDENACVGGDPAKKASIWTSDDARAAWKTYARLHTRLLPYYEALGAQAHETGAPIIRHVFLDNPTRVDWAGVDDAYYVGPSLFAAPVVTRNARERTFELPPGRWLDFLDHTLLTGGAKLTVPAPLGKLPLYLGENRLVPLLDPRIDTLSAAEDPVVGPAQVADVYDVVGLVTGSASFTLADGASFVATLGAGPPAPPSGLSAAADEATLATCAGCYRIDDLGGGLSRVRLSVSGDGTVSAGGLSASATHARARTRWDLFVAR
jgi:alpha-glucosidase (family GH31 glycosyl hydrolase)